MGRSSGRSSSRARPTAGLLVGCVSICAARLGGSNGDHIVPSVRPTHLLPPKRCPLVDRTLDVAVEPGGAGPIVAEWVGAGAQIVIALS